MTLLLKNYDPGTDEGRQGLERAKAWEKGVFLKEAEAAQVGGWVGGVGRDQVTSRHVEVPHHHHQCVHIHKTNDNTQMRLGNDVQAPMSVRYLSERSVEDSLSVRSLFV